MNRDSLTVETPAGTVRATAGPRRGDAVVFELGGAMRGSVHVTGTHHPQHWDQFTAVRVCLGPVNAYQTTAPDDALPRLARGSTGYRGSLRLYTDVVDRPQVSVYPMETAAGHEPSPKTAATLTAVLRACAEDVMQLEDLPAILTASRQRDTPALLRFLDWSVTHHQAEAARLEAEARAAHPARRAAAAAWWTVARWFTASPHPVLLVMLADYPGSLVPRRLRHAVVGPLLPDRGQSRTRAGPPRRDRGRRPAEPADPPGGQGPGLGRYSLTR
ncbi:hypothetical protein ABZ387_37450 [Streptomyces flaveolus]|uniref:hypothetical protein n=1 Tax=Streptomyces flaveolus TaxID=67297 RepID=UPI0033D24C5D